MNPNNPSYPTIWRGSRWYLFNNFCSKTKKNPLKNKEQMMRMYPAICKAYHKNIFTGSVAPEPESANIILEAPTIVTPTKARILPKIWCFSTFVFKKKIEKIKVVTIVPPLIIWYTEPGMKLRAMYWRVEVTKSHRAGIARRNLFIFNSFPWDFASNYLILKLSGFLLLMTRKTRRERN